MNRPLHKCIFLDRDGIINHDPGDYTHRSEEFSLLPGVCEALKNWQNRGFKLIVITNQGGIAKGLYTHDDVRRLHDHMNSLLADKGVWLTDIFYAPGHPAINETLSRKPSGLMIQRAMALHDIDPKQSAMIGDRPTDAQAALNAGIRAFLQPINTSLIRWNDVLS